MSNLILAFAFFVVPILAVSQARAQELESDIVINEIHYNSADPTEFVEFLELYNRGLEAVDLSGWYFSEGIEHVYSANTVLAANAYYILAENKSAYDVKFGSIFKSGVKADEQWMAGGLSNNGEEVTLRKPDGVIADRVNYKDTFPWPVNADGGGVSMQLINASADNNLSGHWRAGEPTPGKVNRDTFENPPPAIRQVQHTPDTPSDDDDTVISAKITDADSVRTVALEYQLVDPGNYIRLSDADYTTEWESMPMNDDGRDGDAMADDATFTVTLSNELHQHRRLVRYRIVATDDQENTVTVPYEDDPTPNFAYFVYNGVPAWTGASEPGRSSKVTFSPEQLTTLPVYHLVALEEDVIRCQYTGPKGQRYLGTLVYDGIVYDHIEFRIRGEVSLHHTGKNKWRFHFKRGRDFQARDNYGNLYPVPFRTMNFGGCASPWIQTNRGMAGLDESVAFKLYNLAGVPSPATHYVHFRVVDAEEETTADQYEGDLWGLYQSQEQPDGRFLARLGLPDGNTYKIEGVGLKKNQGPTQPTDNSDFSSFVAKSRQNQPVGWWRENLNWHSYFGFRATNRAVSNIDLRDGWNHYYYHHPDGRWHPVPWDLDMAFVPETHWSGTIDAKTCLRHDAIETEYKNRCRELLDLLYSDASATGGQVGQVVEEYFQFVGTRFSWLDVAEARKQSSTVTITTTEPHGFSNSKNIRVRVTGADNSHLNGSFEAAVTGDRTFTYKVSIFAPNTSGGNIQVALVTDEGSAWWQIDESMWNHHPRTRGDHIGAFYVTPASQDKMQGGILTRTLSTPDIAGFAQFIKDFTTDTDRDGWKLGDGDQFGYGYHHLASEAEDSSKPDKPEISYTGPDGFPADRLQFQTSDFKGGGLFNPQTFAAMQWRIGEIYNPATPNYLENTPWRYEATDVWRSDELAEFSSTFSFPVNVAKADATYRARVRTKSQSGGWSHWSDPIQIFAGAPNLDAFRETIVISEIMYNPAPPNEDEIEERFTQQDFEYLELTNIGSEKIDLNPLRFTKGVDYEFGTGNITLLQAGASVLVVKNQAAFEKRYGPDLQVAGQYEGRLANGGERIKLSFGTGTGLLDFTYDDEGQWPTEADGQGQSLEFAASPREDPGDPRNWRPTDASPGVFTPFERPKPAAITLSLFRDPEAIRLRWNSVPKETYLVQYSRNLMQWVEVARITSDTTLTNYSDATAARIMASRGYYRLAPVSN